MTHPGTVIKLISCPSCGVEHEVRLDGRAKELRGILHCRGEDCAKSIVYEIARNFTRVASITDWTFQPNWFRREVAA